MRSLHRTLSHGVPHGDRKTVTITGHMTSERQREQSVFWGIKGRAHYADVLTVPKNSAI